MLTDEELRAIEEASQTGDDCPICEGFKHIDVYPPHSAEAYTGAGDPIVETYDCPLCVGIPDLLAEVRRLQGELARYKWRKVSEGLPEMEGAYRVVIVEENGDRITRNLPYSLTYYDYGNWVGLYYSERVTHWAEMPPPLPEEGK